MGKPKQKLFEIDGRNGIWSIPSWCSQAGMSEPTYYKLDPRPHEIRLGDRLKRITESPRDYAERVRKQQAAA